MFDLSFLARAGGGMVASEPGFIVGPIARFFGFFFDLCFRLVYAVTTTNALGLSIILLTTLVFLALLPITLKSHKSMMKTQALAPEVAAIRKKYGDTKDTEKVRKMNMEIQALYAKNNASMMGGCLPLLLQMPLFVGIFFIMNNSFLYIDRLGELYTEMAVMIQSVPHVMETLEPLALNYIPAAWQENGNNLVAYMNAELAAGFSMEAAYQSAAARVGDYINLNDPSHLARVLNRFQPSDWDELLSADVVASSPYLLEIQNTYNHLQQIVRFLGLSLIRNSGWRLPGVIIPLLSVLTMMGSTYISMQKPMGGDP